MDIYAQQILDHYKKPHNEGSIKHADISHEEDNPLCGDRLRVDLVFKDDVVADLKFTGNGCAISQAAISMLSDKVIGQSFEYIDQIDKQYIIDMLGIAVSERRLKCALLCLMALKNAIADKQGSGRVSWHDILEES
jgi:nitrogen fixation NifU-like protein